MIGRSATILVIALMVFCATSHAQSDNQTAGDAPRRKLSDAPLVERQTLTSLLTSQSWARRAIAAMRLDRYDDDESRTILTNLLKDPHWQVRCFAVRALGRLRGPINADFIANENNPRVIRTLLRYRYTVEADRLRTGVEQLAKSSDLADKMLAAEIGAASGDEILKDLAKESTRTVILRMKRTDAGLSPRLATLTNVENPHRTHLWQQWLMKKGRSFELHGAFAFEENAPADEPGSLAKLEPETFSDLEQYIKQLHERDVDLAIVIDCTASMFGELAQAQGDLDSMMLFISDIAKSLRVGIVAYRDHRDEFETRWWNFTSDIKIAGKNLWSLSADGGGDGPELVYDGLKAAQSNLSWIRTNQLVLVLIGDAPPHVGTGQLCVDITRRAHDDADLTTHVIQAIDEDDPPVKHFPEIAEAGGGQCVNVGDGDSLVAEITGLTLGKRFKDEMGEFFRTYLELCR